MKKKRLNYGPPLTNNFEVIVTEDCYDSRDKRVIAKAGREGYIDPSDKTSIGTSTHIRVKLKGNKVYRQLPAWALKVARKRAESVIQRFIILSGKRPRRALYFIPDTGRTRIYRSSYPTPDKRMKLLSYARYNSAKKACDRVNEVYNDNFMVVKKH